MEMSSELATKFHALYDTTMEILDNFEREKLNEGELKQKDVKGDLQDNAKVLEHFCGNTYKITLRPNKNKCVSGNGSENFR